MWITALLGSLIGIVMLSRSANVGSFLIGNREDVHRYLYLGTCLTRYLRRLPESTARGLIPSGRKLHFQEFNQLFSHPSDDKYDGSYEQMAQFIRSTPDGSILIRISDLVLS